VFEALAQMADTKAKRPDGRALGISITWAGAWHNALLWGSATRSALVIPIMNPIAKTPGPHICGGRMRRLRSGGVRE
jgi:hypothetical protein